MKTKLRKLIARLLYAQVRRLRHRHQFKVVAVAGSIGKTSTKMAIAQLLGKTRRIGYQEGNYNVDVTIPLVYFGASLPSLFSPFAWAKLFIQTELAIRRPYPYDVVVLELGTDGPGQMKEYLPVVKADVGVLTAITPEHMEYFGTLDGVAKEEGVIAEMCTTLLVNKDLVKPEHFPNGNHVSYGTVDAAITISQLDVGLDGLTFTLDDKQTEPIQISSPIVARAAAYSLTAAVIVARRLGLTEEEIKSGILSVTPAAGRLQLLKGVNNTKIIDDSYNASPEAVKGVLDTLYTLVAPQKVALLGNMNELGGYSKAAHAEIGTLCDPGQLDLVLTLGADANDSLAAAAEKRGCKVQRTQSPLEAADFIIKAVQPGAVILVKGSQNGVYAEETVKKLLANPSDAARLVRQSKYWMDRKRKQFPELTA